MTDVSILGVPRVVRQKKAQSVPLPKPEPFGLPVLIGDCATPLVGETVLSLLMKRLARNDLDKPS